MTDMTRKLALLCTVSVLTLGLAACNSTGTKTPVNPGGGGGQGDQADTSELGKARTAAKTAMDAAKTASDGAETQAGNAETAVMGLALIQKGDPDVMAKKKAMEAREAARAAMEAYETAKAESEKAAAATSVTDAVTARRAAEEARAEAVKQQMAAAAAAKAATDAAAKEVRVTYDADGKATVSVGDTKIVAGSPKVSTTTGGVTVTSGKAGDIAEDSREFRQAGKQGVAGPPATYQTGIEGRFIPVGSWTDSKVVDSKQSRLWLVDKYIATATVNAYRRALKSDNTPDTFTADATTSANPFGSVTDGDRTYKIMRAEGQFYITNAQADADFSIENDAHDQINGNTPDTNAGVGVYVYTDSNNKKHYLIPAGTASGVGNRFVYQRLHVWDATNFPVAKAYEHMNFGMWNKKSDRTELGTAFVTALPGGEGVTPADDMPNFGKATYRGHAVWQKRAPHDEGKGSIAGWHGTAKTMADFGKNTIRTDLFDSRHVFFPGQDGNKYNGIVASLHGEIDGNGFSGDRVTNVNNEGQGYNTPGFYPGAGFSQAHRQGVGLPTSTDGSLYQVKEYRGNFFGANAEEVGGVFHITSEGKKNGELQGSFGGRRGDIE